MIFWSLHGNKDLVGFIVARISRLYPAYWASILFTVVVLVFLGFFHLMVILIFGRF